MRVLPPLRLPAARVLRACVQPARVRHATSLIVALLLLTSCAEFDDPVIPNVSSPAFLQLNVRAFDQGAIQVDGSLLPGRDSTGFQRVVQSPFIDVNGMLVVPSSLGARGLLTYSTSMIVPRNATGGPFLITPPDVRDVGSLPAIEWYGLTRVDPDTIRVAPGSDIVLQIDTAAGVSQPPPTGRQWFLDVRSGSRVFRLSSDGLPPMTLRIPAEFIPEGGAGPVQVSLIFFQTTQLRSPTSRYNGSLTLDVRLNWTVLFEEP